MIYFVIKQILHIIIKFNNKLATIILQQTINATLIKSNLSLNLIIKQKKIRKIKLFYCRQNIISIGAIITKAKRMPVIRNKASRVAYRKVIKQLNQPLYLQQILIQKDEANKSDIQKYIDQHNQYKQEGKEGLESGMMDLQCLEEPINFGNEGRVGGQVVVSDLELNGKQNEQGNLVQQLLIGIEQKPGSQNNGNKKMDYYYEQFTNRNKTRNSYSKVQRQRLNIEMQNYKDILKASNKKILALTQSIQTLCTQLESIYKKCRQQLTKLAYPHQTKSNTASSVSSTTIQKYKNKEQKIQQYIQKECIMLTHQLDCRRFLVRNMLKNQYYQDCGLVWLIQDIVEFQVEEVRIWGDLRELGVGLGLSDAINWGKNFNQLKLTDFPDSLDFKSKQYLFDIYLKVKKQKHTQREQSSQVKSRSSDNFPQSPYILGSPSSIFPHSPPASLKNSLVIYPASPTNGQIPSSSPPISSHPLAPTPTFLFSRTNDSILRKSNIVDLSKNIEVHTLPQKYNYDIKCIYANTKQSLLKWVKGKCKQVKEVHNRYQNQLQKQKQKIGNFSVDHFKKSNIDKKDVKKQASTEEGMLSSLKLETQASVLVSGKEQEITYTRIGSFVNSPMKMKNMQQIRQSGRQIKTRQKQIKQQGFSLPLIPNSKKQNFQAEYNKLTLPVKNKKPSKNNRNQFRNSLKKSFININNPQKSSSYEPNHGEQKDLSILSKQQQRFKQLQNKTNLYMQLREEKELKQKIRILRVYAREKQEWALKLMFGIQVRREQLIHHLYW